MNSVVVVHETQKKVLAIAELLAELQILETARLTTLFRACKGRINPSTFKTAMYAGRLTKPMCDELSRLCNLIDKGTYSLLEDETFVDLAVMQATRESTT